jgi:hypothetical protein
VPATHAAALDDQPPASALPDATAPIAASRKGTITDALFQQLDVNNDGVISRSEFRRGLKGEIIVPGNFR